MAVVAVWSLPPKPVEVPVVGHLEALERMAKLNMDYLWSMVYSDYQPPTAAKSAQSITSTLSGIFEGVVSSKPRLLIVVHALFCVGFLLIEAAIRFSKGL